MSWVAGWSKRIQVTVDSSKIDETLTDFPVLVHLDNTTASGVFDELGVSSKKLAIYLTDHSQQCYTEIERWDASGRNAWLWTKIPTVVSGSNTRLYLYYDSSKDDNSSYVGTRGSTAGQNVWDDYFLGVFHCNEAPTGADAVKDSTLNNLHLTSYNMESGDLKDAVIGKGLEFDGVNEYAQNSSSQSAYDVTDEVTTEVMFNMSLLATNQKVFALYDGTHHVIMGINASNLLYPEVRTSSGSTYGMTPGSPLSTGVDHYYVVAYKNTDGEFYAYDGLTKYTKVTDGNPMSGGNKRLTLGRWSSYEFGGLADEARFSSIKRSDAWLKASYYSNFNDLLNYGVEQTVTSGSLGYGNRLKLTISPTNIDSNLSDFPVLVTLTSGCGTNTFDATDVFTELGSDSNRKKIAITTEDGISECFTEIEKWDTGAEIAYLWVNVPLVRASADTVLYLYYDDANPENTDFVGDVASYPGQQVWTNGFEAVYHMGESSGGIVDSTINGWDSGTPGGSPTRDADAKVGGGIDWTSPGTAGGSMSFTDNQVTVETWVKHDSVPGTTQRWYTVTSEIAVLRHEGSGTVKFFNRLSGIVKAVTASSQVDTNWGYFAGTWNGGTQKVYKSGAEVGSTGQTGTLDDAVSFSFNSGGETFYGLQDETRVSIVARTESWLKATYHTANDNLISLADSPPSTITTYTGYVKLEGSPVARTVYLYNRSTGALVGSTTSDASTGYFEISTYLNTQHFSVILPNVSDGYQPITSDQLDPEV